MDPPSPFINQFNMNFIPSRTKLEEINHIISSALDKRSRIDEKIRRFKILIDDLYLQQKALDLCIEQHRAMISGIRRLPTELIQMVFHYCLPARNAAMSAREAPLLLGRVCSRWRQIAYTTPTLWSSLHVSLPRILQPTADQMSIDLGIATAELESHMQLKVQRYGEAMEAWLQRSSRTPLSLSIFSYDNSTPSLDSSVATLVMQTLLGVLARYSSRWRTVAIHIHTFMDESSLAPLEERRAADFPLLEKFTLDTDRRTFSPGSLSILNSPSLRSVAIGYRRATPILWGHLMGTGIAC